MLWNLKPAPFRVTTPASSAKTMTDHTSPRHNIRIRYFLLALLKPPCLGVARETVVGVHCYLHPWRTTSETLEKATPKRPPRTRVDFSFHVHPDCTAPPADEARQRGDISEETLRDAGYWLRIDLDHRTTSSRRRKTWTALLRAGDAALNPFPDATSECHPLAREKRSTTSTRDQSQHTALLA